METISVILTTYNSSKTIESTLTSIFNQTGLNSCFHFELIVIDDCSTDETINILKQKNINFYTTKFNSRGPNKGRNIGLKNATGDYICFIDHDDIWHPEKTLKQLDIIKKVPIVSGGYQVIDKQNSKTINRFKGTGEVYFYKKNQTFLDKTSKSKSGQNVYFSTLMIRNELKYNYFEENFGMVDYDWLLRLFENQESAELTDCLMTRVIDGNNLSLTPEYRLIDYYYSLLILENYRKKYKKEVDLAIKRINGSRARYHYLLGEMEDARLYFRKSLLEFKTLAYFLTSFYGYNYVKKKFNVFG